MANFKIIKDLCRRKNLTLVQLAKKMGITESGLQVIMSRNSTSTNTIKQIADILGVPVSVFFDEPPHPIVQSGNGNILAGPGSKIEGNIQDYIKKINNIHGDHVTDKIEELIKEVDYLRELCKEKDEIIRLQKEKINMLTNKKK